MTTTRTRSRGHTGSRASAAREGLDRLPMIIAVSGTVAILAVFGAFATPAGRTVVAASDHFMLKYAGVFALMLLTGACALGVLATDRIILNPGHRVVMQAVHRAFAFGTLAFLIVHVVLEIAATKLPESATLHVHVIDVFVPFLSQYRTFYMAEGTIASDLIILLAVTGILRRRFTVNNQAWKWRAIHYTNYIALILGVLHGLLAGRRAIGIFVYWSYGAAILLIALAVVVRFLATSLRSKQMVAGAAPVAGRRAPGPEQSMPARAAALGLMSQVSGAAPLGGATRAIPALPGGYPGMGAPYSAPYATAVGAPRPEAGPGTGPQPRYGTGPQPGYGTGPQPGYGGTGPQPGYGGTGPQPGYGTGPQAGHQTGPQPAYPPAGQGYGPRPRPAPGTGPRPVYGSGSAAGPVRPGSQEYPYGGDSGYGRGAGADPGFGPGPRYAAGPRDASDGYQPGLGYEPAPRDYESGSPQGYRAGGTRPPQGRRRRPRPSAMISDAYSGPSGPLPGFLPTAVTSDDDL